MYLRMEPIINRLLEKRTYVVVVDLEAVKSKLIKSGQKALKICVIYYGIDKKEIDQNSNT